MAPLLCREWDTAMAWVNVEALGENVIFFPFKKPHEKYASCKK